MKKLILSITILLVLPLTTNAFSDVPSNYIYSDSINNLVLTGAIKDSEKFQPSKKINKAAFLKISLENNGFSPEIDFAKTPFLDVEVNSWYAPYVQKALQINLIEFDPTSPYFKPSNDITRAQGIELIAKLEGIALPQLEVKDNLFNDTTDQPKFNYLAAIALEKNLIHKLKDSQLFFPNFELKRGEAANIIFRAGLKQTVIEIHTSPNSQQIDAPNATLLYNIWDIIHSDYLYKEELDDEQLIYGAIEGILNELSDPYLSFNTPDNPSNLIQSLDNKLVGIGVELDEVDEQLTIVSPIKDGPAFNAGIQAGDIITKIDEVQTNNLTFKEALELIKGDEGTSVELIIKRDNQSITFEIEREVINIPTLETEIIDNILVAEISVFGANTVEELQNSIEENTDIEGIVLDLRNNPGGFLFSGIQMAELFLEKDQLITIIENNNSEDKYYSNLDPITDLPVKIIINKGSASSSEIFTSAMQDNNRAEVIGETTFGKGVVQTVFEFDDKTTFKLTTARWLTPNSKDINDVGITPDIKNNNEDIIEETIDLF